MALTATAGSSTADSYVTTTEADAYFASHYLLAKSTLWANLSSARKESVLRAATRVIETLRFLDVADGDTGIVWPDPFAEILDYHATITKLDDDQSLAFPRNLDVDEDGDGFIPPPVQEAQCEQAVYLLSFDDSALSAQFSGTSVEEVWAGTVRVKTTFATRGSYVAPMALELLRPFLRSSTRIARA